MIQALWQSNKPFIIRVAAGLAVFLILMNFAQGYRADGRNALERANGEITKTQAALEALDGKHRRHQGNAEVLEAEANEVLRLLALSEDAQIKVPSDASTFETDFARRKSQILSAFGDRAKRINLAYPEMNDINFSLKGGLSDEEWVDKYAQLEVVRRVLNAGVDAQLDRFQAISPMGVTTEPIDGDPDLIVERAIVELRIEGTYTEILTFLRSFQSDQTYLSMEVQDLNPSERARGVIEAKVRAVGIDVGPPREEKSSRSNRSGRSRGGF